ncbi:hypothetical protein G163CM_44630 [Pseudocitrobacter corydidari]|uniref:Uncharacterized protein n=1 Tax=Pseudocitrobacter corydidari TaxID=2891570 RepID=A0ABY3SC22_9ENTR|nr:hypothetical protein G163CM_44630 [Pseudocitrobacter corydidari]
MCVNVITMPSVISYYFMWDFVGIKNVVSFIENNGYQIIKIGSFIVTQCTELPGRIIRCDSPRFDLHFQAISINGISTRRRITEKSHTQCIRNQPFSIVTNRIILGANYTSRTQLR